MRASYSLVSWLVVLAILAIVPAVAQHTGETFYVDLFSRIVILAIAVVSLDLLIGFGGMVSFGHAAYLGLGSYAVGILSFYGIGNGFVHFAFAAACSAIFAFLVGIVSLRVRGAYFIMITLAFTQFLYFLSISLATFGGDDGMVLAERSSLPGLDMYDGLTLYYLSFAVLVLTLFFMRRLVRSRFGIVLDGIRQNERRMAAIGVKTFRYKLAAFVIAGTLCGIAGALLANHEEFISPAVLHWSKSGDLLVMAIMGGIGTLLGGVVGAFVFIFLEILLSGYSEHWHLVFGPLLVLLAVATRNGLLDLKLVGRVFVRRARPAPAPPGDGQPIAQTLRGVK